jgi:hypothetical protein
MAGLRDRRRSLTEQSDLSDGGRRWWSKIKQPTQIQSSLHSTGRVDVNSRQQNSLRPDSTTSVTALHWTCWDSLPIGTARARSHRPRARVARVCRYQTGSAVLQAPSSKLQAPCPVLHDHTTLLLPQLPNSKFGVLMCPLTMYQRCEVSKCPTRHGET